MASVRQLQKQLAEAQHVNLLLEAACLEKDERILTLQQQTLQRNAAEIEQRFRELLKPPKGHLFDWRTRTFVAPPAAPKPAPAAAPAPDAPAAAPPSAAEKG